jgi:CheY-like chemotaxis protein
MRRILVVDDEPDTLALISTWLEQRGGCEVRTAQSGEAAVEISRSFQPDVLITDYLMPGDVTGVDLIVSLRQRGAKVRCVLMTGVLQVALLEAVRRLHGIPILSKPFDLHRLGDLIGAN